MNIRTIAAAFAVAAILPVAASAQTESVSFSIENNYDATIDSVFYGESSSEEWSDNILEGEIAPGETMEVVIDDGLEDCEYDFHYTFDDGSDYTEMNVDLCELNGSVHEFTGG